MSISERKFINFVKDRDDIEVSMRPNQHPLLVSHSSVSHAGREYDVLSVIDIAYNPATRDAEATISTNVGEVPETHLGKDIVNELNHRFKDKFVTFPGTEPNMLDVVYVSKQSLDVLKTKKRLDQELNEHGHTKALVFPLLEDACNYRVNSNLPTARIRDMASSYVRGKIDLQLGLADEKPPIQSFTTHPST